MSDFPVLVIGMGNPDRGDDGIGIAALRKIAEKNFPDAKTIEIVSGGLSLVDAWAGATRVVVLDAVSSGAKAGAIFRVDARKKILPTKFFRCSTHDFGVAEAVEMSRSLGQLPASLVIYGVEGKNFELGAGLSPEAEKAVEAVVERLTKELQPEKE